MSVCKGCGREIDWIRTTAGKPMPIDPEPVFVIEGDGKDRWALCRIGRPARTRRIFGGGRRWNGWQTTFYLCHTGKIPWRAWGY